MFGGGPGMWGGGGTWPPCCCGIHATVILGWPAEGSIILPTDVIG